MLTQALVWLIIDSIDGLDASFVDSSACDDITSFKLMRAVLSSEFALPHTDDDEENGAAGAA